MQLYFVSVLAHIFVSFVLSPTSKFFIEVLELSHSLFEVVQSQFSLLRNLPSVKRSTFWQTRSVLALLLRFINWSTFQIRAIVRIDCRHIWGRLMILTIWNPMVLWNRRHRPDWFTHFLFHERLADRFLFLFLMFMLLKLTFALIFIDYQSIRVGKFHIFLYDSNCRM